MRGRVASYDSEGLREGTHVPDESKLPYRDELPTTPCWGNAVVGGLLDAHIIWKFYRLRKWATRARVECCCSQSAVARSPRIARTPIVGQPLRDLQPEYSKVASYHERPIIIHTLPNTSVHFPLQSSPGTAIRAWMRLTAFPASVEGWVWLSIAYLRRAWIKD